MEPTFN